MKFAFLLLAVLAILALPITPSTPTHHSAPACYMGPGTAYAEEIVEDAGVETLPGSVYEPAPGDGGFGVFLEWAKGVMKRLRGDGTIWRSVATRA